MIGAVSGTQDTVSGEANPETVRALLDETRWMLEEERADGARLDTRLAVLTGFAGLTLALTAPTFGNPLPGVSGIFFDVFYTGAVLLLALTALLSVSVLFKVKVIWLDGGEVANPRRTSGDDLLGELGGQLNAEPTMQVERRITATLVERIDEQRAWNDLRWTRFRLAALTLVAALLLVVAEALLVLFAM